MNMASAELTPRAEPGDCLIVIHDFQARSSDELSLAKGDKVDLIERDDEFGDGWFLGRHVVNGNTGLFPQVYTRPAPKSTATVAESQSTQSAQSLYSAAQTIMPAIPTAEEAIPPDSVAPLYHSSTTQYTPTLFSQEPPVQAAPVAPAPHIPQISQLSPLSPLSPILLISPTTPMSSISQASHVSHVPQVSHLRQPTQLPNIPQNPPSPIVVAATPLLPTIPEPAASTATAIYPESVTDVYPASLFFPDADSHVLHDTLHVIDEHITGFQSNHTDHVKSANSSHTEPTTDSGSDYSARIDHRQSYIAGDETDEDGEPCHTHSQVFHWTCDDVAEYLFTAGVESRHCELFRDQEITGEVLLGMDQNSLFLPAFELGSVGRRLKTWHRIKALQDEIDGSDTQRNRRTPPAHSSDTGLDAGKRSRSRASTLTGSGPRPDGSRVSHSFSAREAAGPTSPTSAQLGHHSPTPAVHAKRPSAASIRDLHHSRRHSSTDFRLTGTTMTGSTTPKYTSPKYSSPKLITPTTSSIISQQKHNRLPSFDRNWTAATSMARPLSSVGFHESPTQDLDVDKQELGPDADRGYFSGTEADGRKRNVLRKVQGGSHSRASSYADEQRTRGSTMASRSSRYGSADYRDAGPSATQKYYGLQAGSAQSRRTPSSVTADLFRLDLAAAVTTVDEPASKRVSIVSPTSPISPTGHRHVADPDADWFSALNRPTIRIGPTVRAASETLVSGRNKLSARVDLTANKESPVQSPTRTGSTTPSGGLSFELDSPDVSQNRSPSTVTTTTSKSSRKKTKKETSAYTQGLLKVRPADAIRDADYCGWMRKKSSNMIMAWKPRLFVLKGRRLSYFYSEDDEQEKGLIDISCHRVLPADNEKLTGLHATISGAGATVGPHQLPTMAEQDDGGDDEHTAGSEKKAGDSTFIFKLVPPRTGLSRAVTFTKPMVHYFAVPNVRQGRLWMAALMKATIDRDDSKAVTTTFQQPTISLTKARALRHRPPALMIDEPVHEDKPAPLQPPPQQKQEQQQPLPLQWPRTASTRNKGGNILGITFSEVDSGVSGLEKLDFLGAHALEPDLHAVAPLVPKSA